MWNVFVIAVKSTSLLHSCHQHTVLIDHLKTAMYVCMHQNESNFSAVYISLCLISFIYTDFLFPFNAVYTVSRSPMYIDWSFWMWFEIENSSLFLLRSINQMLDQYMNVYELVFERQYCFLFVTINEHVWSTISSNMNKNSCSPIHSANTYTYTYARAHQHTYTENKK